jgi:predicted RNA-binding protein YlqC (UPF0109 family)
LTEPTISAPSANVRTMIEKVAKALVEAPDAVSVTQVEEGPETVLELTVAETDMGKVIGKQGRTVRAMRNLVGAAGVKANKRFVLEILE